MKLNQVHFLDFMNFYVLDFDFPRDTYIDFGKSGCGKGVVFVNGKNLGRYWSTVGPQQTLYLVRWKSTK